ncbi:MAG: CTP synthase [Candidatus Erwinia impunctatus]|nr:CTP synthase [Culicoides impunctatus]
MLSTFIFDAAQSPGKFGLAASLWANQQKQPLWSLRPDFNENFPNAYQHVVPAGNCVTGGLYRSDTLQHEVSDIAFLPAEDALIVLADADAEKIRHLAGQRLFSQYDGNTLSLLDSNHSVIWQHTLTASINSEPTLTVGLVADEQDQREVYPATIDALMAAARCAGISLQIRFFPPASVTNRLHELNQLDGILLPGGASMPAVAGQIAVAHHTLQHQIPTLGLCLGMQSMCTAALQLNSGYEQAMLAEVAPDATVHSFIPFTDRTHRCGLFPFPASAPFHQMHYNHRYYFNPQYLPQLAASGIRINAQTNAIIEGINHPAHPFWQGVQGHPELMSRPETPHPLFVTFIQTMLAQG